MKNNTTSFKLFMFIGFLTFVNYSYSQSSYVVGESVEDSLAEFWLQSTYCYYQPEVTVSFSDSKATGVSHVLIITDIETDEGVTSTTYTDHFGVFEVGDTLLFDGLDHAFYCPESVEIHGVFKAVGVPEIAGEIYDCGDVDMVTLLGECEFHFQGYGFSSLDPECEVQPTDCVNGNDLTVVSCESYTLNNKSYTESGLYEQVLKNTQDCDSIISLELTILEPQATTIIETACESYSYNGEIYDETGVYEFAYDAKNGCDSTVTLDLTILEPQATTIIETACESYSYNGETYDETGVYTYTEESEGGCDSTVTLDLTIYYEDDLNTEVNLSDNILTAQATDVSYQWLNCDEDFAPIEGEVYQAFNASQNGNYAVEISNGACVKTSDCKEIKILSLDDKTNNLKFNVYPNPSQGDFTLTKLDASLAVIVINDVLGKQVYKQQLNSSKTTISTNLPTGVYLLNVIQNGNKSTERLVVH